MTTAGGPSVERCPNCGAPLELDNGHCRWCGVPVHAAVHASPKGDTRAMLAQLLDTFTDANVFYGEPDDIMLLQPVSNILIFMNTTGMDPAVTNWVDALPQKEDIRALVKSVRQAGTRIKLVAMQGKHYDEFSDNSGLHTPEEWWQIDLALDILTTMGSLPGISPMTGADAVKQARDFRSDYSHHLKKARKGPAPAEFGALRATIPAG
jgi:hypothetical protein